MPDLFFLRFHKGHCTLRETGAGARGNTEAGGGHPQVADILLGLEHDDVDLWSKETAEHH